MSQIHQIAGSAVFNQLGQYTSSPVKMAYCYVTSSLAVDTSIASTPST